MLKENSAQTQGMVASKNHLASATALLQQKYEKFKGDPIEFKTFLIALYACVQ